MATKTFEELKQLAIQIRDEKTNKQNTATRVGTEMLEHINKLEQDYYDKTQTDEELKERDDKLTELESKSIQTSISDEYNEDYHVTREVNFLMHANEKIYIEVEIDSSVNVNISAVINNEDNTESSFSFFVENGKASYEYTPTKSGVLDKLGVKLAEELNFNTINYRIMRTTLITEDIQKNISGINERIGGLEGKLFKGTFTTKVPSGDGYFIPNLYSAQNTPNPIYRNEKNTVFVRSGDVITKNGMEDNDSLYGQSITIIDKYTKEHTSTDIAIHIKKGITYKIEFNTSDLDNVSSINTNILYESKTVTDKLINVTNGKGILVFTAEEDGGLGAFGYSSPDKVTNEADIKYNVYIESSLNDKINNIINNETEIFKKAIFTRTIVCEYGPDKPNAYSLNVSYKKGQKVILQVSTDSVDMVSISGNPISTSGSPYFKISQASPAEVEYTFSEDGILGKFGQKEPYSNDFIVTYIISVYPKDSSLEERIENLENNDSLEKGYDGIRDVTSSLIEEQMIRREVGFVPIIRKWGFISDSLGSGEMECFTKEGEKAYIDLYDYSWGQQICRLCGSEGYNFSKGGMQVKSWLNTEDDRCWSGASKNPKQAYISTLGINDAAKGQTTVGSISTDVDISDCENNADTFAGNYAKLLYRLRTVSPRSKIFVVTIPKPGVEEWNDIIRGMATLFDNVYCIDIEYLKELYYNNADFRKKYYMNGHMNPMGYLYHAYVLMKHIDYIMQTNFEQFADAALWDTEYMSQVE